MSSTDSYRAAGDAEGTQAGEGLKSGAKGIYGATEQLRHGINSFLDDTIQPSAARDSAAGTTASHKDEPRADKDADMLSTGTAPTTGNHTTAAGTSGFSGDAKKLGQGLMDALSGDKTHSK